MMMTNNEKGIDFEKECYRKLEKIGFSKLVFTSNNDNGADIIGAYQGLTYVFQCKNHKKKQGNRCVQEVIAARLLYGANRCVVISNSEFTLSAIELAKANNCILLTFSELLELNDFPPVGYLNLFQQRILVHDINYNLMEKYEEVRRSLHRTPKWSELEKHLQYRIRKEYKNYRTFLDAIGDKYYSMRHSDEEIRQEYLRIRSIICRVPTLSEIKQHSTFPMNSFHAYPFTKLQKECGDRPNIERGITKERLIDAYFLLEKRLGHPPTTKEIDNLCEYRSSYYRRRWGSMDAFLDSIGRTRTEAGFTRRYTREEIICVYFLIQILISIVKEKNGSIVNYNDLERLKYNGSSLLSPSTISKRFGGWHAFVQYIHDQGIDVSIDDIIEEIRGNGIEWVINALKNRIPNK